MIKRHRATFPLILLLLAGTTSCLKAPDSLGDNPASRRVRPGFNLFSPQQDVELGRQSSERIIRQTPMLDDPWIDQYISQLGSRLAAHASGEKFAYQFRVVATSEVNAFALPGGFLFINAGLLSTARNEGELAGVISHEIAHAALRHGTSQASKQQLASLGLGILGSIAAGSENQNIEQAISAIGGLGANMLFLRFGRTAEKQADLEGARMMAEAGYDPRDMADFFSTLKSLDRRRIPEMLSDHPDPGNRQQYIIAAISSLPVAPNPIENSRDFEAMQQRLARNSASIESTREIRRVGPANPGALSPSVRPEPPASVTSPFRAGDGSFAIQVPANWAAVTAADNNWIFAPSGAYGTTPDKSVVLTHGLLVGHISTQSESVLEATNALVGRQIEANPDFQLASRPRPIDLAGFSGLVSVVTGPSPVNGTREIDVIYTVFTPRGTLIYLIAVAPEDEINRYRPAIEQIIRSLQLNNSQ